MSNTIISIICAVLLSLAALMFFIRYSNEPQERTTQQSSLQPVTEGVFAPEIQSQN